MPCNCKKRYNTTYIQFPKKQIKPKDTSKPQDTSNNTNNKNGKG